MISVHNGSFIILCNNVDDQLDVAIEHIVETHTSERSHIVLVRHDRDGVSILVQPPVISDP